MSNFVRLTVLSVLLLLSFLAAAAVAQSWLQRQHSRIQSEALETKQRQFQAALEFTADLPAQWSPAHLDAIGRLIDAKLQFAGPSQIPPRPGHLLFLHDLPATAAEPPDRVAVEFEVPRMARLSLLHGRTWVLLLIVALSMMLLFVSVGLLLARRIGNPDTRTPWSAAKADMSSLERLARTSIAQDTALAHERSNRARIEKDLSLHQQLQNQTLEEKIRLGRDLHDGVIQSLYAVGLTIEAVRPLLAKDPAKAEQRLKECLDGLNRTIRDVREYIIGLSPEKLRRTGFADAVQFFLQELRAGRDVQLDMVVDEDAAVALNAAQTTEALQITHEAISNALRHGNATLISIRLHRSDEEIGLMVRDNGSGFDPEAILSDGHGLHNMKARATGSGATLRIDSQPGSGTRIVMTFPVASPA